MITDTYSKILNDNPSEHLGLKFEAYAAALKDIIEASDPQFAIGIFGGWGSGKTTLMHAIEKQLNDKKDKNISVWFNAWRYEKEEHLIIPLLDTLRDALVEWATAESNRAMDPSLRDRAIKAASTITKAAKAIFAGLAVKAKFPLIEVSLDANKTVAEWKQGDVETDKKDAESPQSAYHASFKALRDSLGNFTQDGEQRIVVFIDDLDRCLPANALQVLESMKLFFDMEGFIFVVGLDQKVIEASINWNYRLTESSEVSAVSLPIKGADYIKKLFQVPFNLPGTFSSQLEDYLDAILLSAKERDSGLATLISRVKPHLRALIGDSEMNPREVKRFINSYILQKKIRPTLDDDVTLLLQTIAFRPDWTDAYEAFRSKPDEFAEAAKRQLDGENDALKDFDSRLERLPESFFQYISSGEGGRKLAALDPSQLAEQVGSLEETQAPSARFALLAERLIDLADELSAADALEFVNSPERAEIFRHEIRRYAEELRARLQERSRAGRLTRDEINIESQLAKSLNNLMNESDLLRFTLQRGNKMKSDEFGDVLKARSEVVNRIRETVEILKVFIETI